MAVLEPIRSEEADPRPWAIYARLSKATDGGLEKVEHQVELCRTYAANRGIGTEDSLVFKDESLSAWKRGVRREGWDRMMALAERGALAGILVYAVDRFTRRPKDLEALIELADEHGLAIEGPRSGRLDLTTATGRQQARWSAMQAAAESDNTSERVKMAFGRKRNQGKPIGGGRSYGFEKGGVAQRPEEVAVIREVARRMLAGESAERLAAELNDRGLTTSRGGQWTGRGLIETMGRLRNGGHVEHRGRVVGTIPGEPILDPATFEALSALITSRRRGRPPTGQYPLTTQVTCSTCENAMTGRTRRGRRTYECSPTYGGCRRGIDATHVEAMVDEYMIGLLSDPTNIAQISARERALSEARAAQLAKVEAVEERLADLEVKWAAGELVQRAYVRAKPVLDKQLAKERVKLDGITHGASLAPMDARADWQEATDAERRVYITRFGVRIVVGPHRAAHRFDPERVRISR